MKVATISFNLYFQLSICGQPKAFASQKNGREGHHSDYFFVIYLVLWHPGNSMWKL